MQFPITKFSACNILIQGEEIMKPSDFKVIRTVFILTLLMVILFLPACSNLSSVAEINNSIATNATNSTEERMSFVNEDTFSMSANNTTSSGESQSSKSSEKSAAVIAYTLFIQGQMDAVDPDKKYSSSGEALTFKDNSLAGRYYGFYDMNGDEIPELHLYNGSGSTLFTFLNNEIVVWRVDTGYYTPLINNSLIILKRGNYPMKNYQYITLDENGDIDTGFDFGFTEYFQEDGSSILGEFYYRGPNEDFITAKEAVENLLTSAQKAPIDWMIIPYTGEKQEGSLYFPHLSNYVSDDAVCAAFQAILQDNSEYYDTFEAKKYTLQQWLESENNKGIGKMVFSKFIAVDVDEDMIPEIILKQTVNGNDYNYLVLHYDEGEIKGYIAPFGSLENLSASGYFSFYSAINATYGYGNLIFKDEWSSFSELVNKITYCDINTDFLGNTEIKYYVRHNPATADEFVTTMFIHSDMFNMYWADFSKENIDSFLAVEYE